MDLLDRLADRPADFNLKTSSEMTFIAKDKSQITPVRQVYYDDSNYFEQFTGDDILNLVESHKIEGVIVPVTKMKDMVMLLMDSYAVLMDQNASLEDRLKVSNRINDLLSPLRLL